jgi:hypothetical protein
LYEVIQKFNQHHSIFMGFWSNIYKAINDIQILDNKSSLNNITVIKILPLKQL